MEVPFAELRTQILLTLSSGSNPHLHVSNKNGAKGPIFI
jgi:hypothetical protein